MAFGAHPDDVEILCAGTLAKYAQQGHAVAIAVATNGEVGSPTLSREEIAAIRQEEAQKAAAIINAEFYWMGYPDEFLYDSSEVRRHFIDVIRQFRPDIVLCPDKDHDYHPDHQRTGQIVWETHVMTPVPNVVTAHPPCSKIHEIWFYDTVAGINFHPEIYVDITGTWEIKMAMLSCHASQAAWLMTQYGIHPNYYAETQSRFRGYQTGCTFAEAFRKAHVYPSFIRKEDLLPMPG
jgi:LmbE family N-acetylglucosaminyl deacetylase